MTIDRSEAARAMAKAIAYKACGKDQDAAEWAGGDTAVNDITYQNLGSFILMLPETDAARDWAADNLPEDATMFGDGICIEPRYFPEIAYGAQEDGLTSNVLVEPR